MSGSTNKKVVLARFDREPVRGFVNPQTMLRQGQIEMLAADGTLSEIGLEQIKAICFVRDLDGSHIFQERREFRSRPKSNGLWIELVFHDGDTLEGLIPNNLLMIEAEGISLTPPDLSGNTQRVLAPRQALREVAVRGVIGVARKKRISPPQEQIRLFPDEAG